MSEPDFEAAYIRTTGLLLLTLRAFGAACGKEAVLRWLIDLRGFCKENEAEIENIIRGIP